MEAGSSALRMTAQQALGFATLSGSVPSHVGSRFIVNLDFGESVDLSHIDVSNFEVIATINGADGGETIAGTSRGDFINGLGGDDRIVYDPGEKSPVLVVELGGRAVTAGS